MCKSADDSFAVFVLPLAGKKPTDRLDQKLVCTVVRRFRGSLVDANLCFQSLRPLELVVERDFYEARGWRFSHALENHFPGVHEPFQIVIAFELDCLKIGIIIHGAPLIVKFVVVMD
jgi:hypothetical protein